MSSLKKSELMNSKISFIKEFITKYNLIYLELNDSQIELLYNFLKNGIYTLAILLEKNNIGYKTITGYTTNEKIQQI